MKHVMQRHCLAHSGEKTVQCPLCPKMFIDKNGLRLHLPYHSDVRAFSCDLCGKQYKARKDLQSHAKRVHPVKVETLM